MRSLTRSFLAICAAAMLGGALALPATTSADARWTTPERVSAIDLTRGAGSDAWIDGLSMAVDSNGYVHVALSGMTRAVDGIWYLSDARGRWTTKRVSRPPAGSRGHLGHELKPSLAIDDTGAVSVAYVRVQCAKYDGCPGPSGQGIFYTTNSDGSWSTPRNLIGGLWTGLLGGPSLVLRDGAIHLAYGTTGYEAAPVFYATDARGELATRRVTGKAMAFDVKLVIDQRGAPHVLVLSRSFDTPSESSQLGYWTRSRASATFVHDRVPMGVNATAYDALLSLDSQGNPTVGWTAYDDVSTLTRACVSTRRADRWSEPACVPKAARLVGLQVDSRGAVHVLVIWPTDVSAQSSGRFQGTLVYATDRSGSWTSTPLVDTPVADAAIALDPNGRPNVVYVVGGHGATDGVYHTALT